LERKAGLLVILLVLNSNLLQKIYDPAKTVSTYAASLVRLAHKSMKVLLKIFVKTKPESEYLTILQITTFLGKVCLLFVL